MKDLYHYNDDNYYDELEELGLTDDHVGFQSSDDFDEIPWDEPGQESAPKGDLPTEPPEHLFQTPSKPKFSDPAEYSIREINRRKAEENARLARLSQDHQASKSKDGADPRKRPSYHARRQIGANYTDSPEVWASDGMKAMETPEFPMNVNLFDLASKSLSLNAMKLMFFIQATAYRKRQVSVDISKKAIKTFLKTSMPHAKKAIQELEEKEVTLAATGLKSGSQPVRTTILARAAYDTRSVNFLLSDAVFHELDFKSQKYLYAQVDLHGVHQIRSKHALGIYPLMLFRSRLNRNGQVFDVDQLGILMGVSDLDKKIYKSEVIKKLKKALKGISKDAQYLGDIEIYDKARNNYTVRLDIEPGRRPVYYQPITKGRLHLFRLRAPEGLYIQESRFANLAANMHYPLTEATADLVRQNWILYCQRKICTASGWNDFVEHVLENDFECTDPEEMASAFKFWNAMIEGEQIERSVDKSMSVNMTQNPDGSFHEDEASMLRVPDFLH